MIQEIAVFVIVALAVIYATWTLMPRTLRARLAQATVALAQRRGRLSDQDAVALAQRLTASGCGGCERCGARAPGSDPATASDVSVLRFVSRESNAGHTSR